MSNQFNPNSLAAETLTDEQAVLLLNGRKEVLVSCASTVDSSGLSYGSLEVMTVPMCAIVSQKAQLLERLDAEIAHAKWMAAANGVATN